ncbi:MAG: hypothetical protein NZT61_02560 [Deltaproteobacteria bacterium]|nr:hypothetical protein [Deltaproteobacteria bacterium]
MSAKIDSVKGSFSTVFNEKTKANLNIRTERDEQKNTIEDKIELSTTRKKAIDPYLRKTDENIFQVAAAIAKKLGL